MAKKNEMEIHDKKKLLRFDGKAYTFHLLVEIIIKFDVQFVCRTRVRNDSNKNKFSSFPF